ncbi:MAG: hypothetical protein LZF86_190495 [Nitrospira sp.]|nr:MAG: hypothetical protein LZF86_190495 [Nitrospira sp.]
MIAERQVSVRRRGVRENSELFEHPAKYYLVVPRE